MHTVVSWEYIAIDAREPEETVTMTMIIAACVTGSVLTSRTNFISGELITEAGIGHVGVDVVRVEGVRRRLALLP
jgi:hypothetical protein